MGRNRKRKLSTTETIVNILANIQYANKSKFPKICRTKMNLSTRCQQ